MVCVFVWVALCTLFFNVTTRLNGSAGDKFLGDQVVGVAPPPPPPPPVVRIPRGQGIVKYSWGPGWQVAEIRTREGERIGEQAENRKCAAA